MFVNKSTATRNKGFVLNLLVHNLYTQNINQKGTGDIGYIWTIVC